MIEQTVGAPRLSSTGYASAWALCHHLARNERAAFHALLREVSKLGPFEGAAAVEESGLIEANCDAFRRHLGHNFADIESKLIKHLQKLPYRDPFAETPHFVAMGSIPSGKKAERSAVTFRSRSMAEKWRKNFLAGLSADQQVTATTEIRHFPNRALAEQFAASWLSGE
jgi:hypothetical protein